MMKYANRVDSYFCKLPLQSLYPHVVGTPIPNFSMRVFISAFLSLPNDISTPSLVMNFLLTFLWFSLLNLSQESLCCEQANPIALEEPEVTIETLQCLLKVLPSLPITVPFSVSKCFKCSMQ